MIIDRMTRLRSPRMSQYRRWYAKSKKWDGTSCIKHKHLVVYCEQGLGDIIQFARYLPAVRKLCKTLTLHCPTALHRLLSPFADNLVDRASVPPSHDVHVLSMTLPFLLQSLPEVSSKYLHANPYDLGNISPSTIKIGIAWEGNPEHSDNKFRSCPLKFFKRLASIPNVSLFMLQKDINLPSLCDEADFELLSVNKNDLLDTAMLIEAMDFVVSVDTSVLHLAGALGKTAFGLLSSHHDFRWNISNWYTSVVTIKQRNLDDWDSCFDQLFQLLNKPNLVLPKLETPHKILLTGGIGDVIALESFMSDHERKNLTQIHYATKAANSCVDAINAISKWYPKLEDQSKIFDNFNNRFCIYSKNELSKIIPSDINWESISDWSILSKFPEIESGERPFNESSFLKETLVDIKKFELPTKYLVLVPESENALHNRNFNAYDWAEILHFLKKTNQIGVILRTTGKSLPTTSYLINLTGKTSLIEAIEIVKNASGYCGVDSCLSVIASKILSAENLRVKSTNPHLYRWKEIYYAPQTTFEFIQPTIQYNSGLIYLSGN